MGQLEKRVYCTHLIRPVLSEKQPKQQFIFIIRGPKRGRASYNSAKILREDNVKGVKHKHESSELITNYNIAIRTKMVLDGSVHGGGDGHVTSVTTILSVFDQTEKFAFNSDPVESFSRRESRFRSDRRRRYRHSNEYENN